MAAMYGSLVSVLLMGMVPVWGGASVPSDPLGQMQISRPASAFPEQVSSIALARSLSASGVVILDVDSGQRLFGKLDGTPRPIASLTKLMTALLIVEHHSLHERVTVPGDIEAVAGSTISLTPGAEFSVGDLLSALLIGSANDAAVSLARFHSGTVQAFVTEMNDRARELGLRDTSYANPAGFDAPTNHSTPRDLAWLTLYVLRHEPIRERMGMRGVEIRSAQGERLYLTHTHALLHADNAVVAGKTGTTTEALQCLVSLVEAGRRRYVVVLLHSGDRYADMQAILHALAV